MTRETLTKEHIANLKRSIQENRGGLKGHYNPRHSTGNDEKYQKVKELMERPLGELRLCAVLIDGTPKRAGSVAGTTNAR